MHFSYKHAFANKRMLFCWCKHITYMHAHTCNAKYLKISLKDCIKNESIS